MSEIWQGVVAGAAGASWLEQVATIMGIAGVWLAMRENIWNFPVGLGQVTIFGWVCFQGKLYSETALQVFFFAALLYGWRHWTRGDANGAPLRVHRLTRREGLGWTAAALGLWLGWGTIMVRFTDAALPWADAFVFAASVISQWLQARKVLENWVGWLVANTTAIAVFWLKGFYWFAGLYAIFWVLAAWGLRTWWRAEKAPYA